MALVLAGYDLTEYEVRRGLTYCIKEIVRNVFEHSGSNECFIAGQRWRDDSVEIVIMDEGVGILKTLSESYSLASDHDALISAIKPGVSRISNLAQSLNLSDNSGFGLYVLSQIGQRFGQFVLGSGTAALCQQTGKKAEIEPTKFFGTFVGVRMNERPANFRLLLDEIVEIGEKEATHAGIQGKASSSSKMS